MALFVPGKKTKRPLFDSPGRITSVVPALAPPYILLAAAMQNEALIHSYCQVRTKVIYNPESLAVRDHTAPLLVYNCAGSTHLQQFQFQNTYTALGTFLWFLFLPPASQRPNTSVVQVVGTGDDGSSPCLVVSVERTPRYSGGEPTENKILRRYLFNVGEGTQVCCVPACLSHAINALFDSGCLHYSG